MKRILLLSSMTVASTLMFVQNTPRLLWNVSASAPIGLYLLQATEALHQHDLIAVRPSAAQEEFLEERQFLGKGALLLKHIAALPGARICRFGKQILIDGDRVATAQKNDHLGRALPVWQGCRTLATDEIFLLNPARDSLDSRYFGSFQKQSIVGRASAFWIRNDPNASHQMHANF